MRIINSFEQLFRSPQTVWCSTFSFLLRSNRWRKLTQHSKFCGNHGSSQCFVKLYLIFCLPDTLVLAQFLTHAVHDHTDSNIYCSFSSMIS